MTTVEFQYNIEGRPAWIHASALIYKNTLDASDDYSIEGIVIEAFDFETNQPLKLDDMITDAVETKLLNAYLRRS